MKRVVNNKMKGAYGATSFVGNKPTKIEINKKRHKNIKKDKSIPKRSRTLIDTIAHEEMHARHPKMHEKTVRRLTPRLVAKMTRKTKQKMYARF